jgi:hypothetical protein
MAKVIKISRERGTIIYLRLSGGGITLRPGAPALQERRRAEPHTSAHTENVMPSLIHSLTIEPQPSAQLQMKRSDRVLRGNCVTLTSNEERRIVT